MEYYLKNQIIIIHMSHLAHSQLNDSQIQKITYPNLTEVRYEENTEKVFVGIPTQNSFI